MIDTPTTDLQARCELLRSLHRRGDPLLLPNAWDVATAKGPQVTFVTEAVRRANAYLEAGVDCVYPICLWELDPLRRFMSEASGPVNITRKPTAPSIAELSALGVARVSWGPLLQWDAMARFQEQLASLRD